MHEEIDFKEFRPTLSVVNIIDHHLEQSDKLYVALRNYFEDVLSYLDNYIEAVKKYNAIPTEDIIKGLLEKYNSIDVVNYIDKTTKEITKNRIFSLEEKIEAFKCLEDLNKLFPFVETLFDDNKISEFIMEIQTDSCIEPNSL